MQRWVSGLEWMWCSGPACSTTGLNRLGCAHLARQLAAPLTMRLHRQSGSRRGAQRTRSVALLPSGQGDVVHARWMYAMQADGKQCRSLPTSSFLRLLLAPPTPSTHTYIYVYTTYLLVLVLYPPSDFGQVHEPRRSTARGVRVRRGGPKRRPHLQDVCVQAHHLGRCGRARYHVDSSTIPVGGRF